MKIDKDAPGIVLDISDLLPDKSYDECLQICKDLGLIEIVRHGLHDYGRFTQTGINVWWVLLRLLDNRSDPKNLLKQS
jgi:hypothetical protein